jgi:hypothetical protein
MPPPQTKQARLVDVDAHAALVQLQRALGSQSLPRNIDLTDILSALAMCTTPPQAAGMLAEYWRYCERRAQAESATAEAPQDG